MNYNSLLSFLAALFCFGLAGFVFFRDHRPLIHRAFIAGMVSLAFEAVFTGLSFLADSSEGVLYWQRIRMVATSFVSASWLLFALCFGRTNFEALVKRYRLVLLGNLVVPLVLLTLFQKLVFKTDQVTAYLPAGALNLGSTGFLFYICLVIGAILILMNLEETLRSSTGRIRWQIKFTTLGIGGIFAFRIYSTSQALLFSVLNLNLEVANEVTVMAASVLVAVAFTRLPGLRIDIYPSRSLIFGSLTAILVGAYLIIIGLLARVVYYFGLVESFYLDAFLVFLAFLGLTILFLSDRVRTRLKRFISLHLKRPQYDYRKKWMEFTEASTSVTDVRDFCDVIARKVSKTLEVLSASIWLLDETEEGLKLCGSTTFTSFQAKDRIGDDPGAKKLVSAMRENQTLIDFALTKERWARDLAAECSGYLEKTRMRVCVPLSAGGNFLGLLTVEDRVGKDPFSPEDFDLLKTIGDQTAGILLNLKLHQRLQSVKETEAIQTMSAFMMHDLKNLASMLSLTMENLPIHFDNPDFRQDAINLIRQSVSKMNDMCSHLVLTSQEIKLNRNPVDLNDLVGSTLSRLNGPQGVSLTQDLHRVPILMMDSEQIQKVLTNLVLNAQEAVGDKGEVRVSTSQRDGWVVLTVSDNGCGMSRAFMEQSLFRPFKTTKKRGMGIGLYHSRLIVEAHQGRIEVESEVGKGSTFRVLLRAKQ